MNAWQVIGFCGVCELREVPTVKTALVQDPTGSFVVAVDIARSEADLLAVDLERMTLDYVDQSIGFGDSTRLPPVLWEPDAILYCEDGALRYIPVWQGDQLMSCFVAARREEGRVALERGDREAACEAFDLARRVSNESDDIERVIELTEYENVRESFIGQLKHLRRAV